VVQDFSSFKLLLIMWYVLSNTLARYSDMSHVSNKNPSLIFPLLIVHLLLQFVLNHMKRLFFFFFHSVLYSIQFHILWQDIKIYLRMQNPFIEISFYLYLELAALAVEMRVVWPPSLTFL
jgi:hypothetical protein